MEVEEASAKYLRTTGYKQTEVGTIPEDWDVTTVGEISEVKTGPFGSALHEKDYVNEGTPIITVEHLGELGVLHSNLPQVSDADRARLKTYALRQGDIVFSRVGSVDRNALIKASEDGWLFSGRLLRVRPARERIHSPYLSYHFHSETFKQRVRDVAVGQTMASINTQILKGVKAVFPPTKAEQAAIAEVLSDADALIESLSLLLAKKRHLKQGAMQELLTGKKRLPGFSGEWEVKRLGEVGPFLKGSGVRKDESFSGDLPCIRYGEIYTKHNDYIKVFHSWISPEVAATAKRLKQGDLLFAGSGETKEEIGKCVAFVGDMEAYAGGDTVILRPENSNSTFLGYYLNTAPINRQKASRGQGDAVVHISSATLSSVEITIPKTEEQTAIASILSDMDTELAALEAKLAKARNLKQGMMQELLTGRIRLV
jgi:type I restriction enzyme, S subunit